MSIFTIDHLHQQDYAKARRLASFATDLGHRDRLREQIHHVLSSNLVNNVIDQLGDAAGNKKVEEILVAGLEPGTVSDADATLTEGCHIIPFHVAKLEEVTAPFCCIAVTTSNLTTAE